MKYVKKILIFVLLVLLVLVYTMVISSPSYDEIWNYGYGYNIAQGLVPYRDFNMLATPLWLYLIALFIKIFGDYLLSMHLLNAIVIVSMFYLIYMMIGNKVFIMVPLLLIGATPTYNVFSAFLFILFIYFKNKNIDDKKSSMIFGLIISMLFLTKQTLGGLLFVVEFFKTNNKKKYVLSFMLPVLVLSCYFIMVDAFYEFIDYSFLGMLDFGSRNSDISIYLFFEVVICILILYFYKKYKYSELLYVLAFQFIAVPMFDFYHFMLAARMFVLVLLLKLDYASFRTKYFVIIVLILCSFDSFSDLEWGIFSDNTFLLGRNVGDNVDIGLNSISSYISEKEKSYDKVYVLSGMAYMIRLNMGTSLDKFDMILDGNMGYKGYLRYIEEIDDYCEDKKCMFLVEPYRTDVYDQTNHEIINYVIDSCELVDEYYMFDVYSNDFNNNS